MGEKTPRTFTKARRLEQHIFTARTHALSLLEARRLSSLLKHLALFSPTRNLQRQCDSNKTCHVGCVLARLDIQLRQPDCMASHGPKDALAVKSNPYRNTFPSWSHSSRKISSTISRSLLECGTQRQTRKPREPVTRWSLKSWIDSIS